MDWGLIALWCLVALFAVVCVAAIVAKLRQDWGWTTEDRKEREALRRAGQEVEPFWTSWRRWGVTLLIGWWLDLVVGMVLLAWWLDDLEALSPMVGWMLVWLVSGLTGALRLPAERKPPWGFWVWWPSAAVMLPLTWVTVRAAPGWASGITSTLVVGAGVLTVGFAWWWLLRRLFHRSGATTKAS